jgi:Swt1-like HEPN
MPRTNSAVLDQLRTKLGRGGRPVTHQALEQRRKRIQDLVPMPPDIANYIVAQREGVRLHKHLDEETLERVATFEERLRAKEGSAEPASAPRRRAAKTTVRPSVKELRVGEVKVPKNALSQQHMADAARMAAVYPVLYAFENSMREYVDGHLTAGYGDKWWDDPKIVNTTIRGRVERNRNSEARHRYHSRRTARPIYYTDIGDLPDIATSENAWKIFKPLLPSDKWLYGRVEVIEASRNVVAHMNVLQKRDIDRIRLNFEDWLEQIKGTRPPLIP